MSRSGSVGACNHDLSTPAVRDEPVSKFESINPIVEGKRDFQAPGGAKDHRFSDRFHHHRRLAFDHFGIDVGAEKETKTAEQQALSTERRHGAFRKSEHDAVDPGPNGRLGQRHPIAPPTFFERDRSAQDSVDLHSEGRHTPFAARRCAI